MNGASTDPQEADFVATFERVLRTLGWKLGQNLLIEYRWGNADAERIKASAAELVGPAPDLIVANTTTSFIALRKTSTAIPIVFLNVSDPVAQGFSSNIAHPEGNATGFAGYEFSIGSKWTGLLKQLVPSISRVAMLFNPVTSPQSSFFLKSVGSAAAAAAMTLTALPIHDTADIEPAIAGFTVEPNGGLIIATDNFLAHNAKLVTGLAAGHRLPAIYAQPLFVQAGGLMSYSDDLVEVDRGAAIYVDRILKGAKPSDLPIQFATKFKLTINLKALQALGLEMPMSMMLSADELIE
jgi:putative ABC transport system substrate-binding protein